VKPASDDPDNVNQQKIDRVGRNTKKTVTGDQKARYAGEHYAGETEDGGNTKAQRPDASMLARRQRRKRDHQEQKAISSHSPDGDGQIPQNGVGGLGNRVAIDGLRQGAEALKTHIRVDPVMGHGQVNGQRKSRNAQPQNAAEIYAVGEGLHLRFGQRSQGYALGAIWSIVASHFILDTSTWNVINCAGSSALTFCKKNAKRGAPRLPLGSKTFCRPGESPSAIRLVVHVLDMNEAVPAVFGTSGIRHGIAVLLRASTATIRNLNDHGSNRAGKGCGVSSA